MNVIWDARIYVVKTLRCTKFWDARFWAARLFSFPQKHKSQGLTVFINLSRCQRSNRQWNSWTGEVDKYLRKFYWCYFILPHSILQKERTCTNTLHVVKMASVEAICCSYECSPLLSLFVCVKKTVVRTNFFSKKSKAFNVWESIKIWLPVVFFK